MKLAIPIWQDRISPVLDYASLVRIVDVDDGGAVCGTMTMDLPVSHLAARVGVFKNLGVDVVICGAISMPLLRMLQAEGVRIIPGLAGDVSEVQQAFLEGTAIQDRFPMPGCGRAGRRRQHRRGRHCRDERRFQ